MTNNPPKEVSMEEFLKESPNLYSRNIERHEDWDGNNEKEVERIEKTCKNIGTFDFKGLKCKIYFNKENDNNFYYLIDEQHPTLLFLHEIKEKNMLQLNGVESLDIWQNHILRGITNKGISRYWIFNFILKNYDFVMSDKLHTPVGKHFWMKLLKESIEEYFLKSVVYNTKENKYTRLYKVDNIDDFYSKDKDHLRFIIFRKGI